MERETHFPMYKPEIEFSEIAPIPLEYAVAKLAVQMLQTQGYEAYIVGGAVRDLLLGKTPKDFDLATNATPEQILAVSGFLKSEFKDTAQAYAVARVRLANPNTQPDASHYLELEIATFRREVDAHLGRKQTKVEYAGQLEHDVVRRDFTINALALDPINNQLIDYVGGLEDLRHGVIRFVGEPDRRIAEDPLRILRAVRFRHRFGFTYDQTTEAALREAISDGRLESVPGERIRDELTAQLTPAFRIQALDELHRFGALDRLLPELRPSYGDEQSPKILPEGDGWQQILFVLKHLQGPSDQHGRPTDPSRRLIWAALLDDFSKLAIRKLPAEVSNRHTFLAHARGETKPVRSLLRRLRFSNKEIQTIIWLQDHYAQIQGLSKMSLGKRRELMNNPAFADLLELVRAGQPDDHAGTLAAAEAIWHEHRSLPIEQQRPSLKDDFGIDGVWLMQTYHLNPGKEFGALLKALEEQHLNGEFTSVADVQAAARLLLHQQKRSDRRG